MIVCVDRVCYWQGWCRVSVERMCDAPHLHASVDGRPHDDALVHGAGDKHADAVHGDEVRDQIGVPRDLEDGRGLVHVPAVDDPVGRDRHEHLARLTPAQLAVQRGAEKARDELVVVEPAERHLFFDWRDE